MPLGVISPLTRAGLRPASSRQNTAPTGAASAMSMHMVLSRKTPLPVTATVVEAHIGLRMADAGQQRGAQTSGASKVTSNTPLSMAATRPPRALGADAAHAFGRGPALHRISRTVPAANAPAFDINPIQGLLGHRPDRVTRPPGHGSRR